MGINWIEALQNVSKDDLDEVDDRLDNLKREIEALSAVRKVLAARLGCLTPPRPHRRTAPLPTPIPTTQTAKLAPETNGHPAKSSAQKQREQAAKFLLTAGPTKPSVVAFKCSIPTGSTQVVFDHPWFERTDEGLVLTPAGRADIKRHSAGIEAG